MRPRSLRTRCVGCDIILVRCILAGLKAAPSENYTEEIRPHVNEREELE